MGKQQAELVRTRCSGWDLCQPKGLSNGRVLVDGALGKTGPWKLATVSSEPAGGKLRSAREVWSGWPWLSHIEEVPGREAGRSQGC